jgi:hypothetical protein
VKSAIEIQKAHVVLERIAVNHGVSVKDDSLGNIQPFAVCRENDEANRENRK